MHSSFLYNMSKYYFNFLELMKSNKIILFSVFLISCNNSSNQDEKSIKNFESCKKYTEYYEKYLNEIEIVKGELKLSNEDTFTLAYTFNNILEDTLLQIFSKDSTICDKEKIMRYSLRVEDKNKKVADGIIEITNAYQYESIFFIGKIGKENLYKKVIPPEVK